MAAIPPPPSRATPAADESSSVFAPQDGILTAGTAVRAFYHMNDHPHGFRYVRLHDGPPPPEQSPEEARERPSIGMSTGWMPATVAEDWDPAEKNSSKDSRVLVRFHGRFADAYNQDPEPVNSMYWKVKRCHVRPMSSPQPQAELSLLVVRWWDYYSRHRKSRSHDVKNEDMLLDILEGTDSPQEEFAESGRYEIHSAFIRNSADLELLGKSTAAAMRGKCKAALYFLWPTQREAVEKRLGAAVAEPAMFALMNRMDEAGVPSRWPHPPALYRQLAGKLWPERMCTKRPDLRVAPTVTVDRAQFEADADSSAQSMIAELKRIRVESGRHCGDAEQPYRGVVKLSFSWMGEDVRPFTGADELVKAVRMFLDGAQPDAVCLVQERIEDVVCEMRLICCRDLANGPEAMQKELVRMKMHGPNAKHGDETFALTSHLVWSPTEAVQQAFQGDAEAMKAAESTVQRLGDQWLQWFRDEGYGTPAACRLDFLVALPAKRKQGEAPDVWTVELCECGGSLCGCDCKARTTACFNECMQSGIDPKQVRPPKALPPFSPPVQLPPAAVEKNTWSDAGSAGNNTWSNAGATGKNTWADAGAGNSYNQRGTRSNANASAVVQRKTTASWRNRSVLIALLAAVYFIFRARRR